MEAVRQRLERAWSSASASSSSSSSPPAPPVTPAGTGSQPPPTAAASRPASRSGGASAGGAWASGTPPQRLAAGALTLALQHRLLAAVRAGRAKPGVLRQLLAAPCPVDLKLEALRWLVHKRSPAALHVARAGLADLHARFVTPPPGDGDEAAAAARALLARPSARHVAEAARLLVRGALGLPQQHATTALHCALMVAPGLVGGPAGGEEEEEGRPLDVAEQLYVDVATALLRSGPHPYLVLAVRGSLVRFFFGRGRAVWAACEVLFAMAESL